MWRDLHYYHFCKGLTAGFQESIHGKVGFCLTYQVNLKVSSVSKCI